MIHIKNFDRNRIKIDKNSYKYIVIYYAGYITTKKMDTLKKAMAINI